MTRNKVSQEEAMAKIKDCKFTVLEDGRTTICNLYLENGFTVRGESSCVDPENFDKEIGERIAKERAVDKVWELEGYLLQEELYRTPKDFLDRMELEEKQLDEKIEKANAFLEKVDVKNGEITQTEYNYLQSQVTAMATYSNILLIRINNERKKRGLPTVAQF